MCQWIFCKKMKSKQIENIKSNGNRIGAFDGRSRCEKSEWRKKHWMLIKLPFEMGEQRAVAENEHGQPFYIPHACNEQSAAIIVIPFEMIEWNFPLHFAIVQCSMFSVPSFFAFANSFHFSQWKIELSFPQRISFNETITVNK